MPKFTSKTTTTKAANLLEEMQAMLVRRFSGVRVEAEPVVYEFTNDRALLHQYYRIRQAMYRKIHNAIKFDGREDLHDKIAHILIARRGKLVVGGCRLIIREGDEEFLLPMEGHDFTVREAFPHLPLTRLRHGEISRFAVLDSDTDHLEVMLALSQLIIEKCVNEGMGYVFIKSPGALMARNWRRIISTCCGQKEVRICTDITMPEDPDYPEIDWQMIKAVLPAAKVTPVTMETASEDLFAVPTDSLVH